MNRKKFKTDTSAISVGMIFGGEQFTQAESEALEFAESEESR